jgi:hypothetical protein
MGFLDIFLSDDKKIQKRQRTLTNRDSQAEDREIAARWLTDNGTGKALLSLLSRFDMQLEHQINDRDERELVFALAMSKGQDILKPLRAHLRKCRKFALPVRLYRELKGDQGTVEFVFELLQLELDKDDFKPGKKTDMLVWLTDHNHPGMIEAVTPFLKDFDEGVRCAAAEVIISQKDDDGREVLELAFANPEEDSNRLRVRLAEVFASRRWSVVDVDGVAANLPPGHTVTGGRVATS